MKSLLILLLITSLNLVAQNNQDEINQLENKIEELKEELRKSELKLKTLRTLGQSGFTSSSIDYSNKYIQQILKYLGPLEFHKSNDSWIIHIIDPYEKLLLKIPIEDAYGLESHSEFWDLRKVESYATLEKPYLSNIACTESKNKIGFNNLEIEKSSDSRGYVNVYFYNCSDQEATSYKVELKIYNWDDELVEKTIVDVLTYDKVKPGEYRKVEAPFEIQNKIGFFFKYDYKIIEN